MTQGHNKQQQDLCRGESRGLGSHPKSFLSCYVTVGKHFLAFCLEVSEGIVRGKRKKNYHVTTRSDSIDKYTLFKILVLCRESGFTKYLLNEYMNECGSQK